MLSFATLSHDFISGLLGGTLEEDSLRFHEVRGDSHRGRFRSVRLRETGRRFPKQLRGPGQEIELLHGSAL